MYVENNTIGLIMGAVTINAKAVCSGTPLRMNCVMIGTIPHSHEGKKNPKNEPTTIAKNLLFGRILWTLSGVKKTCRAPEMMHPN
jgi:hypothetical protein